MKLAARALKRTLAHRALSDRRGAAAVEFAVVAPLLALILAGSVDFGGAIYRNFVLTNAVSAASNYALQNADRVGATEGGTLAGQLAGILLNSYRVDDATIRVVVNNGPTVDVAKGAASASGTASRADSCYCPTTVNGRLSFGGTVTCGNSCPSGLVAGKFVQLQIQRPYQPFFPAFDTGLVDATLGQSAMVQVK